MMPKPVTPCALKPQRRFYDLPDGRISAVHFGPNHTPPQLVMLHANGFNGYAYRSILEPLDVHSIALDQRGHGMSELPANPDDLQNWHIFKDDITTFFERYIEAPVVLAGHSYGAVTGILAMPHIKEKVKGYVGFDPVMVPGLLRWASQFPRSREWMKANIPIVRAAGRRKYVFENLEHALSRYTDRGAFKGFSQAALKDYLAGGLKSHADGVQLACHPLWEQAIFIAQHHNFFSGVKDLPQNTHIISAAIEPVSTPLLRALFRRRLNGGQLEYRKDFAHLFPFHHSEQSQEYLANVLQNAQPKV